MKNTIAPQIEKAKELIAQKPGISEDSLATLLGYAKRVNKRNPTVMRIISTLLKTGEITAEKQKYASLRDPRYLYPAKQSAQS